MPFAPESFPDTPDPSALPDGLTDIVGDVDSWTSQFFAKPIDAVSAAGGYITGVPGDVGGWLFKQTGIPTILKHIEAFIVRIGNSFFNSAFFGTAAMVGGGLMIWGLLLLSGEAGKAMQVAVAAAKAA